jgi:hypothetical protein
VRQQHDRPNLRFPHADADGAQRSHLDCASARHRHGISDQRPERDHGCHPRCQPHVHLGAADAVRHSAPVHSVSNDPGADRDRDPQYHRHLNIEGGVVAICHQHIHSDPYRHQYRDDVRHALADSHRVGDAYADAAGSHVDCNATGRDSNGDTVTVADAHGERDGVPDIDGHRRRDRHCPVDRQHHGYGDADRDRRRDITDVHRIGAERHGDTAAVADPDCKCGCVSDTDIDPRFHRLLDR